MGVAAVPPWRRDGERSTIGALAPAICAAIIGAALVFAQCPPPAKTHPSGAALAVGDSLPQKPSTPLAAAIRLDPQVMVYPADGTIAVRFDSLSLAVRPLLTFIAGSKDGCWSILARASDQASPEPRLRGR